VFHTWMDGDGGYGAFTSLSNLESISSEHFDLFKSRTSTFSTMYDLIGRIHILQNQQKLKLVQCKGRTQCRELPLCAGSGEWC